LCGDELADLVVVADASILDERTLEALVDLGRPICWYVADEHSFTSGVHPAATVPLTRSASVAGGRVANLDVTSAGQAVHDAAACDAASAACAILIGLAWRSGPFRFEA
jgi:hypothetical protein